MIINADDVQNASIEVQQQDNIKFYSVDEYIKCLERFEQHPMGKTQFQNMDFDMFPTSLPSGYLLKKDDANCIILAGYEYNLFLYRGENRNNPDFSPTIKRLKEKSILHCIEWIKAEEFKRFFKDSVYYERLRKTNIMGYYLEPDLDAIAQHYGFKTTYLDVTQSRLVAQFFAMTDYDKETESFFPIENFEDYEPTIYQARITDLYKINPKAFKIVGIQPFCRPLLQFAYAIDTNNFDMDLKPYFEKIVLKPDPEGSRFIYNFFNGGKVLFPDENIIESVSKIRNYTIDVKQNIISNGKILIPEDLLFKYCIKYKLNFNKYRCKLSKICKIDENKKFVLYPHEIEKVNTYITNVLLPWIENNVGFFKEMDLLPM